MRKFRTRCSVIPHGLAFIIVALTACPAAETQENDAEDLGTDAAEFTDAREAADGPVDFSRYDTLRSTETRTLALRRVWSIDLAKDSANVPSRVNAVAFHGSRLYVLDASARKIRGYDRTGRSLFAVGKWGRRDGEMNDPIALAFVRDTLLLLDVSHFTSLSAFDTAGNYVGPRIPEYYDGGTTAFDVLGDTFYVGTLPSDTSARNPYVVRGLGHDGRIIARGCRVDPAYASSVRRNGQLSAYGFVSVAAADGRIYCTQPITPIVQVLNSSGRLVETIKIAPPFYVAPRDTAFTMNERARRAFESTFTSHIGIYATRHGFVSVYYRYDNLQERDEYRLFACDRTPRRQSRCATVISPGAPLGLIEPDTLIVAESPAGAAGPRLSLYVVR